MWFGVTLIVVGVIFMLDNFGFLSEGAWDYIWPILIIIIGAYLILKRPVDCKVEDGKDK